MLLVLFFITNNLNSQTLKCDDIKWVDYEITTDTLYAFDGKIKLAEINGNIFNKINEEIIKELFVDIENDDLSYYLSYYFLTKPTYTYNSWGFTDHITDAYCLNHIFSYQIQSYTTGAQVPYYSYINYDFVKNRKIKLEDIVKNSKKESFNKFMIDYLNSNKKEIIENLKELLSHTIGIYSLNDSEVLNNSAYNLNNVFINDTIDLKYFNSQGIVFSLKLRDANFLEIENNFQWENGFDSYILIPYERLKNFIYDDFYPNK